jgi:hypothetical protein
MKLHIPKALFMAFAIGTVVTFSGCDLFDKANDITFPATLKLTWSASEDGEHTDVGYSHSQKVTLADNADVAKYINKIKSVKVEKVTYRIENYAQPDGDEVIFSNGLASFSSTGSSSALVSVPFGATATGVNLKTSTSDTDLAIDSKGLDDIAAAFKKDKEASVTVSGTLSETPVSFNVVTEFHVQITAEVID